MVELPPQRCEYADRRVALGGCIDAGKYLRQPIRCDVMDRQDRRLRDGLAVDEQGRGGMPVGGSRRGTGC